MKSSTKWTVRILLLVGIGIPVIIEAVTFFGMLGSHMEDGKSIDVGSGDQPAYRPSIGDPIATDLPTVKLEYAAVWARPSQWQLEITLLSDTSGHPGRIRFDSLVTRGGEMIQGSIQWDIETGPTPDRFTHSWKLPPGERPSYLYFTSVDVRQGDTLQHMVGLSQITVQSGDRRETY